MNTFNDIIEKIKELKKIKYDKDVAGVLGINYRTFTTQKNRNSVPFEVIIDFCIKENIPLDFIFGRIEPSEFNSLERFSPAHRLLIERFTGYFAEKVPVPETEEVIEAVHGFIDILMSDNETAKKALKSSVRAFKEVMDSEKEKKKEDSPPGSKPNPRPHTKKTNMV